MNSVTIFPGYSKTGEIETFDKITFFTGSLISIVGNTGSGKSRLIKDIEQVVDKNSVSRRKVLINGKGYKHYRELEYGIIAHLGQNMRFMLDTTVGEFVNLHCECRGKACNVSKVLNTANLITKEPISSEMNLNLLSGGQTRALMIADIALICDSPIVLIDEIENAGIDKIKALDLLVNSEKLVIVVTHDPHTALMAERRIVMKNGGIDRIIVRTEQEKELYTKMSDEYIIGLNRQTLLREGDFIV